MKKEECYFCSEVEWVMDTDLVYAKWDSYPVTEGHVLVITKRHVASYFDITDDEKSEIWQMVNSVQKFLSDRFAPDGYNVGININEAAGQTVEHVHVHIIPRRNGDMENPRGGVRGVIPEKQKY